jgi:biopolymer transport protein TolR
MSMTTGGSGGLSATPNVTPLIDVLLVLLIIFMVIKPPDPRGLNALVPQPPKNPQNQKNNDRTIVVQVTARPGGGEPGYKINETDVSHAQLLPQLEAIYATRATKVMFIKGDPNLNFAAIANVIDIGHEADVDHIGVITPKIAAGQ